jgi:transposase
MNTHKNARLTHLRRLGLVQDITERGLSAAEAAPKQGVSAVTARKWLGADDIRRRTASHARNR